MNHVAVNVTCDVKVEKFYFGRVDESFSQKQFHRDEKKNENSATLSFKGN